MGSVVKSRFHFIEQILVDPRERRRIKQKKQSLQDGNAFHFKDNVYHVL